MRVATEGPGGFKGKVTMTEANVDTRCVQFTHLKVEDGFSNE